MSNVVSRIPQYRKGLIAVAAALVTIASVVGVPLAEDLSDKALAVFDAVAAVLVILVVNEPLD